MKFLVDQNLSPVVADLLTQAGHASVHVRDINAQQAPDSSLMAIASDQDQVIVSADTDFGALLAQSRATRPSVILVREIVDRQPAELASTVLAQLDILDQHLRTGAIVALTPGGIRVRSLPLR